MLRYRYEAHRSRSKNALHKNGTFWLTTRGAVCIYSDEYYNGGECRLRCYLGPRSFVRRNGESLTDVKIVWILHRISVGLIDLFPFGR